MINEDVDEILRYIDNISQTAKLRYESLAYFKTSGKTPAWYRLPKEDRDFYEEKARKEYDLDLPFARMKNIEDFGMF